MTQPLFFDVQAWMHRNARPLELHIWQRLFEGGGVESVLQTLAYYQNEDGGFGHALEADSWNPHSTPYTTLNALDMLRTVGFEDLSHPLFRGIFRYLNSGVDREAYGWRFSVPSNDAYAHAPWWSYDEARNPVESTGLTAALSAFVLRAMPEDSPVYAPALALGIGLARRLETGEDLGEMGLGGFIELLPMLRQKEADLDFDRLDRLLHERVSAAIERDPAQWAVYGVRPSRFIHSPDSPFYAENASVVQQELDYLLDTRPQGAVWDINWQWFGLMDVYAREFAISEQWWKGQKAIENLLFLHRFGRVEIPQGR